MAIFKAIPEILHDVLIYSNDLFEVSNSSTVGSLSEYEIDGDVEKSEIVPEDYLVTTVSKIQWHTSDGKSFSSPSLQHKFFNSGTFQVYLTIWSEPFITGDGRVFYFTSTGYIDVVIQSKFLKLLYDYNPAWAYTNNPQTKDFYIAAAKFFERIYTDTKSLYSLWDVNEINPNFFEYLALTLGHDSTYIKKVGYEPDSGSFNEYDIFDKIKRNKASTKEINNFRRFLIHSSEIFRKKGTPDDITSFLSFFSIDGKSVDLWTKNWGQTPVGEIDETFLNFDLENNKHGFIWNNIRVVGNNNDYGMIKKTLNSITIDSYHKVQKVEYNADVVGTVSASGSLEGWHEFELDYKPFYVVDVRDNNGNLLIDEMDYQQEPFVYELDINDPVRQDPTKLGILQVSPDAVDYGDKIAVSYSVFEEKTVSSLIANKDRVVKNFDSNVTWAFLAPKDGNTLEGFKYAENEIFFAFRGIKNSDDYYSNINQYYRFSINCSNSFCSLSRVVKNPIDDSAITQKINLGTKDSPVYDKLIRINDCDKFTFTNGKYYEFKLQVNGSLVSAYVRENDAETKIADNAFNDTGGSNFGQASCLAWNTLFSNVSLDIDSAQVQSTDEDGATALSVNYVEITDGGNYGVGCKNGILDIKNVLMNILDADETLWTTAEKELDIKPKYLEWLATAKLRFNNDINNNESFTMQISESFDPTVPSYAIEGGGAASLDILYMNNIKVTEDIATRYIVDFDSDWLSRFKNSTDVQNKIIVPFGSQKKWFLTDTKAIDKDIFKNYLGGTDTESVATSATVSTILPGLFVYNESTVLDNYETEPDDNFSTLARESDTSLKFTLNNRTKQYVLSGQPLPIRGIFQEVCPESGRFTSLTGAVTIKYNTAWENPVFSPIIFDGDDTRVVGVRFRSCDDITRLINVNSNSGELPVQLWGHYSIEMDKNYFKYRPDKTTLTEGSSNSYIIKIFVPIGVLDETRRTYGLSSTYLHENANSGIYKINILGIYVRNPSVKYNADASTVELDAAYKNPYENSNLDLLCKHYFSTSLTLAASVENHVGSDTIYVINKNCRSLLAGVATRCRNTETCNISGNATLSYEDDFEWWAPSEIWMKRDVTRLPTSSTDILSNINHNAESTIEKYFYNVKLSTGSKPAALKYRVLDGDVSLDTMYYAKVTVRLDYSGFNYDDVMKFDVEDNALTESEAMKVKTLETPKTVSDYKQSPVKSCHTFYIPIAWYPSDVAKEDSELEWANYITGSLSTASITFTPYGLMTYLINQGSDPTNVSVDSANTVIIATKGWNIDDWNVLFTNGLDIEFIAEKVPSTKYKLFNKLVTFDNLVINSGANINITNNIADTESLLWEVIDNTKIYVKANDESVFEIPPSVNLLRNWVTGIVGVTLNNYSVDNSFYTLKSNTTLTINDPAANTIYTGAELRGKFFYDLFFQDNKQSIKEDNFNPLTDRLKWLPFESVENDIYSASLRKPSETLVFESSDLTYDIINFKGKNSFKSINSNTSLFLDYKKTGKVTKDNNEITFSIQDTPNVNKLYVVDDNNSVFDFTTDVIFDEQMGINKNFDGKKFEHILKAYTIYDSTRKKIVLGGYYFVGVGVYGFDIGLGIAKYNIETGNMDKSFLAAFGDYDTRGIKLGTWYKLRTIANADYIRVIFNEKTNPDRLVINYFINPIAQTDSARYIDGNFEELVYLLTGLNKLNITYPGTLGEKTNTGFVASNFNEELVKNFRAAGTLTGMMFNNELTYVGNVKYVSTIQGDKVFGDTSITDDLSNILEEAKRLYSNEGSVRNIGKTTSGVTLVLIDTTLFYSRMGKPVAIYSENIDDFVIVKDRVIIRKTEGTSANIIVSDENLMTFDAVYVKDLTYHLDHIFKYLTFTNRKIKDIWWGEDKIHLELLDS